MALLGIGLRELAIRGTLVAGSWLSESPKPTFLLDEQGQLLWATCLKVSKGDVLIGDGGYRGIVSRIEGQKAYLRSQGQVTSRNIAHAGAARALPLGASSKLICLYSTHSDESYVPSDGASAIPGAGGIIKVASSFANALSSVGFLVRHDPTPHDPHDALAYSRSRRTASALASLKPYAIIDVHRDAAPAEAYYAVVRGVEVQQIMIVVGRENPLNNANLLFATRLKEEADRMYPGLIRGIFLAAGDYNQDLDPGAILLEVGTDTLPREHAERAVGFMARVMASVLGAPGFTP
ncbi:MAG TPA: hypothetical protein GXX40_01140 [Firmicutes bacterium]|nr:hypothetical protein [Bacillota bacterium]